MQEKKHTISAATSSTSRRYWSARVLPIAVHVHWLVVSAESGITKYNTKITLTYLLLRFTKTENIACYWYKYIGIVSANTLSSTGQRYWRWLHIYFCAFGRFYTY